MPNGYASNYCSNILEKKVFPQEQGVAKNFKSKQTHVGFSMSILVQSQDECMQIKADFLHVFPITIWLKVEEGNICSCIIALHSELPLSF